MRPIPEVNMLDTVFCTKAMEILPPMSDIPEEFKRHHGTKWNKVVSDWFFLGLKKCKWTPKPGVDTNKALAAVTACIGDWSPQHEHKEAGCAYLLSEWFEDVTYPEKESK
jgi:hypothetical protein